MVPAGLNQIFLVDQSEANKTCEQEYNGKLFDFDDRNIELKKRLGLEAVERKLNSHTSKFVKCI